MQDETSIAIGNLIETIDRDNQKILATKIIDIAIQMSPSKMISDISKNIPEVIKLVQNAKEQLRQNPIRG